MRRGRTRGEGHTIILEEAFLRGGGYYKGKDKGKASSKGKQEQSQGKGIKIKTKQAKRRKAHQGKGCLTSQGLWGGLQGTPRHPRVVAIVPVSLVYVSCVVHFALRPSIYICSKLVFPMGGFSRVMLTKNICVNFMHA
jgi:hypothetical protein